MKKMIVNLVSFTPQPIEMMLYAFKNMLGMVPETFELFLEKEQIGEELKRDFLKYLATEPLAGGVQEFVSTVWFFGNVSRAFQQQLTRQRTAVYCIQSLRIRDKRNFAAQQDYLMPDDVADEERYVGAMAELESVYKRLLDAGEPVQVARGVLPLNVFSPITMCVNLRNLRELVGTRLCNLVQGEFRAVSELMLQQVVDKMGADFKQMFKKPCERYGFCPHANGCGAAEPVEETMTAEIKQFLES